KAEVQMSTRISRSLIAGVGSAIVISLGVILGVIVGVSTRSASLSGATTASALGTAIAAIATSLVSMSYRRRKSTTYSAVLERLESNSVDVQAAAISTLEAIAEAEPGLRQSVIDQLCKYLRARANDLLNTSVDRSDVDQTIMLVQSTITRYFR